MKNKNSFCIILLIILSLVSVDSTNLVYGYTLESILMCDDLEINTKNPIGVGDIHLTYNGYIYCWVNFTNVEGPLAIKFEWFQPEEDLYRSSIIYTFSGSFPLFSVYDLMKVAGSEAASNPGKWSVKVYVDSVYVAGTDFYLVDYSTIAENVDRLEELTKVNDQIMSQYVSLQVDFNELIDSFDNLTDSYTLTLIDYNESVHHKNELEIKYDNLISEYEELARSYNDALDEYDELVNDNDSLMKKISSARNTTYAAILGMIIFLAITVYLFKQ